MLIEINRKLVSESYIIVRNVNDECEKPKTYIANYHLCKLLQKKLPRPVLIVLFLAKGI